MARRRDLFPPDRGLQARMLVAALGCLVLSAAMLAGALFLLSLLDGELRFWATVAALVVVAVGAYSLGGAGYGSTGESPTREQVARAEDAVARVAAMADMREPRMLVVVGRAPLSWTDTPLRRRPLIWLTTGLLDRVDDDQLEAVVAHEFSHIARRDGKLMSLLAGPPAALMAGLVAIDRSEPGATRSPQSLLYACGLVFLPLAVSTMVLVRLLSRHREFSADLTAARLTGSPASVASALIAVAGGLGGRDADLRGVAARDAFHFVPVNDREHWLLATHPPIERRLEQLDRLERTLQGTDARS